MAAAADRNIAEKIAGSAALAAISRIGVPLLLAVSTLAASELIALERRVAILELSRVETAAETGRRLALMEDSDRRDRELMTALRAELAALRAGQDATLRAVDRLERAIDKAGRP